MWWCPLFESALVLLFFSVKLKSAYEMLISDWSSDLCSSDLSVMFIPDCIGDGAKAGVAVLAPGDVAVLENTRFYPGEENIDPAFADALAEIRSEERRVGNEWVRTCRTRW